ncbi:MAG: Lrp/AsnC family transcriptional regulator [Nitrososphaeraceae archaeon]
MIEIDKIDSNIIDLLRRNSRSSATQISNDLSKKGISLTSRSVSTRISKLEEHEIIQDFTVRLNPTLFESKHSVLILLKFVPSCNNDEIEKLKTILCDSPICYFATRMIGKADGFDYAYQLVCDTEQQVDLQLSSILDTFKDMIEQCHTYKSIIMKESLRVLQPTQDLKRDNMSVSVSANKQPINDLEYIQNLLSQRSDEIARSIAEQHHQKLD